ncbi:hypothetical protein [Lentilactobacillus sp. Marseille-Q4993]|uniref:hypothetical protein n=1 Tax=Lentilactobacillus sp. Marseille-Q4993 TaxID=3039492 RepID=UPI0024BCEE3D|nr:hypothetical protein [Lentilactobacillus sp. Marseille-Q4993]
MKFYKVALLAAIPLILAGCSSNNSSGKNYKDASKAGFNNSSSSTKKHAKAATKSDGKYDFDSLTSKLGSKLSGVSLPQKSGIKADQTVNIKYSQSGSTTKVAYSNGTKGLPLNDADVSPDVYALLSKRVYSSTAKAHQAIDHTSNSSIKGLPKVKLDHSVVGHTQSGAGQQYITWNKGNWSVLIHGSRVDNTDPKETANQAVELFSSNPLPETASGSVKFFTGDTSNLSQEAEFQRGKAVYTLKGDTPQIVAKMVSSIK